VKIAIVIFGLFFVIMSGVMLARPIWLVTMVRQAGQRVSLYLLAITVRLAFGIVMVPIRGTIEVPARPADLRRSADHFGHRARGNGT